MTLVIWALAGLCLWVVLRRDTAAADARVAAAEAKASAAVASYDSARATAIRSQYASKDAGQREHRGRTLLETRLTQVQDSLAKATAVLRDSSATTLQLRDALAQAIHQADTLSFQASAYLAVVDTLRAKHAEERRAMTVALDRADSALAHQDALIRALQKKAECRILGIRCPSRRAVLTAGVLAGAIGVGIIASR